MGRFSKVLARLRRRPVDPERAVRRAAADAARRAGHDDLHRQTIRAVGPGSAGS